MPAVFAFIAWRQSAARPAAAVGLLFAGAGLTSLFGCGASAASSTVAPTGTQPQYVAEPITPRQSLILHGGGLIVSDGCAACHLTSAPLASGPSFDSFAGHRVTLADGRRVLVDEHFLREGLLHPEQNAIGGYAAAPMLRALKRLDLARQQAQLAALIAFVEQIGPEAG